MNNSFGRKIQRKAKKVDPFMNYTIQNVQGSSNHVFLKDSLSLMAVNFGVEKDLSTLNDTKLAFIEDESGLEEPEFSILPSSMQYRQMFLENS